MARRAVSRREFLKRTALPLAALAAPRWLRAQPPRAARPNILFILLDDMGWKDTGFMGTDFYETPHIDALARDGVVFTHAYANGPNCAPTRASIMSGQYAPRHGIYTVGSSARGQANQRKLIPVENSRTLPAERVTPAEALKAAGYATFHGGKWHLGSGAETGPLGQGFDVNIGGFAAGSPPGGYFAPWSREAPNLADAPAGTHLCDFVTDRALDFLAQHKTDPFFMYLAYYDVHTPLQAKPKLVQKYKQKLAANRARGTDTQHDHPVYAAMIENTDANIGRVLRKLEELNLVDNTVVVFFSDNGGYGGATNMRPLRGCKGMLYEGGIREPLVVRWPGRVKPGTTCDVPVISIDFYPTFLELAGVPQPETQVLDGTSLVPLLTGRADRLAREALFWHFPCYLQGLPGGFKADAHKPPWRTTPCGAVRKGRWKLIEYFEDGALELYDLETDIGEKQNLAAQMPDKTAELHEWMKTWRRQLNAPVPDQPNPEYDPNAKPAPRSRPRRQRTQPD
ncbi:MAG: sulfatase [Kiritimatiellae bacterium]|nr:sulfatase [Kiritimatiellia bacterium]